MNNKILITGGGGYLAAPLAMKLVSFGFQVVLGSRNVDKLNSIFEGNGFKVVLFDIGKTETFEEALAGVEIVVHLAAMGARASELNPELAKFINETQVENLLEVSVKKGIKKFIYFSTVHVYGSPLSGILSEGNEVHPISTYARTHLNAEKIVLERTEKTRTRGIILRLANMIGAPFLKNAEIEELIGNSICKQSIQNKTIALKSSGKSRRDFVSMNTLSSILIDLLNDEPWTTKNSLFNVGSGAPLSILELVKLVQRRCELKFGFSPSVMTSNDKNEVLEPLFTLDLSRTMNRKKHFDESLEQAIDSTLDWFYKSN